MWTVTISVKDRKGKSGSFSLNFDAAKTIAQIEGFINGISTPLNAIVLGSITAINITRSMAIPLTLQGEAAVDSDVEECLRWGFRTVGNWVSSTTMPTVSEAVIQENSSAADMTNPFITIVETAFTDGVNVGGTQIIPSDSRGDIINTVESVNSTFKSSRGSR